MRIVSIVILVVLGFAFTGSVSKGSALKESNVFFSSDSFLKIEGHTNVSTFQCDFNMNTLSDSIRINYNSYDKTLKFNKATLTLPNLQFDCGGKAINKDFNKLLNTDEFPKIVLNLKEIRKHGEDSNTLSATVAITISNIVNTYTVPVVLSDKDGIQVSGVLPLNISDFNLTPPTKMLGMVKVSPEIEIQFSLNIFQC